MKLPHRRGHPDPDAAHRIVDCAVVWRAQLPIGPRDLGRGWWWSVRLDHARDTVVITIDLCHPLPRGSRIVSYERRVPHRELAGCPDYAGIARVLNRATRLLLDEIWLIWHVRCQPFPLPSEENWVGESLRRLQGPDG